MTVVRALRLRDVLSAQEGGMSACQFLFSFFFLPLAIVIIGVFVHVTIEVAEEYTAEPHRSLFLSLPMTSEQRQTDPVES